MTLETQEKIIHGSRFSKIVLVFLELRNLCLSLGFSLLSISIKILGVSIDSSFEKK